MQRRSIYSKKNKRTGKGRALVAVIESLTPRESYQIGGGEVRKVGR